MTANDPGYGMKTLDIVRQLRADGIQKISILMRHSARHYDAEHMEREPLMWLTEDGKRFARNYGEKIPDTPVVRFFSSMLGRCIETAYQADKGYSSKGGRTESNTVTIELAPSFVKKPMDVFQLHHDLGTPELFRRWFAGEIPEDMAGDTKEVARVMIHRLADLLNDGPENHIDIAVSHDWNLTMVKHHLLGLDLDRSIAVEYLEGIAVFEKNGTFFIASHEAGPKEIEKTYTE